MAFLVYRSSAGSGKTFTLVREYLKILLQNPGGFRHILAITFTNKAANEMKDRVLSTLDLLGKTSPDEPEDNFIPMMRQLIEQTGMPAAEIALNSRTALNLILHNYSDFSIGTIDSFSHRIIRTFANDFSLPGNFNIELESDELLDTVVQLLLERVGENVALTNLLVGFIESRLEEDKGWNIDRTIAEFSANLLDEVGQSEVAKLSNLSLHSFHEIARNIFRDISEFETKVRKTASRGKALILESQVPVNSFYYGDKGIGAWFFNLSNGRMDLLNPNTYVRKTIDEDKWYTDKTDIASKNLIDSIKDELSAIFFEINALIDKESAMYRLRKLLGKTIYPLAVLHEVEQIMTAFKKQENIVHISEFNARIASVVMNEPVPFIYERLGDRFNHILLDEFQDTSVLQWMNFVPLVENSLAAGYFNLIVGDGKQAIYRWRNGDIDQFKNLPAIAGSETNQLLKQRQKTLEDNFKGEELNKNFRSKAEIIDFNNRFFRLIADQVLTEGMEKVYEKLHQEIDPSKSGGFVSIDLLDEENDGMTYQEATLRKILEIVIDATNDGFSLRDIAVLCRSNKNGTAVAASLLSNGIDVVSTESLLIKNSLRVRFIISMLKYIFLPQDDIVKAEIEIFFKDDKNFRWNELKAFISICSAYPVYDLCEKIIHQYALNEKPDPYLQFFLDVVLKFSVKTSHNPIDFLDHWEQHKNNFSLSVPEELDAVRVMTIHKAKGLQFPVVIHPFADDSRSNTKNHLWVELPPEVASGLRISLLPVSAELEKTIFDTKYREEQAKSMLDLLNLLYVALTRAEERLYIISRFIQPKSSRMTSVPSWIRYFLETEGGWSDSKRFYSFGIKSPSSKKAGKSTSEKIQLVSLPSGDWRNRIKIRRNIPWNWDVTTLDSPAREGTRLHELLAGMNSGEDIPAVLQYALNNGIADESEIPEIEKLLTGIVCHPELAAFFETGLHGKTEPEILSPKGHTFRPDRVIVQDDKVILMEFKTGSFHQEHARQIEEYKILLGQMGYPKIRALLIYVKQPIKVIEI